MGKITVFLTDAQVLFREGIHFILSGEDDFEVIGETTSNDEACTHIMANPPVIALLGMMNAGTSGAVIARRIKRNLPEVFVILTVEDRSDEAVYNAVKSGASACITRNVEPNYLLDLFRVVAQGSHPIIEEMLAPGISTLIMADFKDAEELNGQIGEVMARLMPPEVQLLNSIAAGGTVEQISEKLSMSEADVRRYLRIILNKVIFNAQARELIEAVKRTYGEAVQPSGDYVTRAEFYELKALVMELLQERSGEAGKPASQRRTITR